MFSSEFCEISKNTFFHATPPVAASVDSDRSLYQVVSRTPENIYGGAFCENSYQLKAVPLFLEKTQFRSLPGF